MSLTTLAYVKQRLGLSDVSSDAFLQAQIDWIEARALEYMQRNIEQQEYTETFKCARSRCTCARRQDPEVLVLTNFPLISITSITVDGTAITADDYETNNNVAAVKIPGITVDNEVVIVYEAGYASVPLPIKEAVTDLVMSRYYQRGGDPTKLVRSETVPDVGSVDYTVSLYYQRSFDPVLGIYQTTLDMYRSERAFALDSVCDAATFI